ncbi:hypothetical protein AB6A40_011105 [Gnathostoma spinigerum]|uniref:Legumain prodomain domain-containing protein n=1 Tax=Gnathostoma spinigerum TaxID=75299 RepID=A0ABD6EWX0_9BILA
MNSNPKEWMEAATKVRDMKMKRTFLDDFMQYFVKTLVPDAKLADKIMKSTGEQVKNFDCSEDVFDYFFDHCFNPARDSYALSKTYLLANLCENGVDAQTIIGHMKNVCPLIDVHDIV